MAFRNKFHPSIGSTLERCGWRCSDWPMPDQAEERVDRGVLGAADMQTRSERFAAAELNPGNRLTGVKYSLPSRLVTL